MQYQWELRLLIKTNLKKCYNENPEICEENGMFGYYNYKPYFDIMFEDKAGFKPKDE